VLAKAGDRLHKIIDRPISMLCSVGMYLVVVMVLMVVVDVVMRLFGASVPGLSEVEVLMMVTVTFFALAYVGVVKGHIVIDLFITKLPPPLRAAVDATNDILGITIVSIMAWQGYGYAMRNLARTTPILKIPDGGIMLLVTLGCGLLAIVILADLLGHLSQTVKRPWWPLALVVIVPVTILTMPIWLDWFGVGSVATGFLSIGLLVGLICLGLPVAFALGIAGFIGTSYITSFKAAIVLSGVVGYDSVADFFLCVIPFFILMGSLCAYSGISKELFKTASTWLGRLPGGLAMATIGGGAGFGAVCGSSFATAATMAKVALPEMKRYEYADSLACGSVAVAGTLGIMIPPSTVFIIYAILAEQSVGALFMAGILPGILIALLVMVAIYFQVKRNPTLAPIGEVTSLKTKLISLKGTWSMLTLFVLVIGGIYTGIFTPVEGGAVGALGAFLYAEAKRMITRKQFAEALLGAAHTCGMILLILVGITLLNSAMALSKIPFVLAEFIDGLAVARWVILAGMVLMYLAAGFIMNIFAVIMLTIPIFLPTLIALDFNLVWFGVIVVLSVMIGQLTPPVGVICFLVKGMAPGVSLAEVFKGVTPLWAAMMVGMAILCCFPQISLFLPNLLSGG